MKKLVIRFLFAFAGIMAAVESHAAPNPDLETVRGRIVAALMLPPVNDAHTKALTESLRKDGKWDDIDYNNLSRTAFQHIQHLHKMIQMSRTFKKENSSLKGNKELKDAIYRALDFWLAHNFIAENWWYNEIATPDAITAILLIMDEDLTASQIEKALSIAARAHIDAKGARQSGDRIKIAGIQAKNALFKRDAATFDMLMKLIEREIRFVPPDQRGMQYDYSFHHRDDHVNNTLAYGTSYASTFVEWLPYTDGTRHRFSEQAVELLIDYYLDGICKQMVYGKYPDPSAANRDVSRRGYGGPRGTATTECLAAATEYRKAELLEIIDIRKGRGKPAHSFGKFFWRSEYYTCQRPNYFTSVRMFSTRNANMEQPHNEEGLMNHHRGDGTNYLSQTGVEYFDLAPVYDWQKIPGTTVLQKASLPSENEIQKYGSMSFVGAVTDGMYGAVAFDFISPHDPLQARKSWFFFDSEYVCLGAGIKSETDNPAVTTINQCHLRGDVVVGIAKTAQIQAKSERRLNDVRWVYHDSVGYIFPEPVTVNLSNRAASGNWFQINRQSGSSKDELSMDVFKLWIDHGAHLNGAAYQYTVMPGVSRKQVAAAQQNPAVEILSNTPELQAVRHKTLNMVQIVFYKDGYIRLPDKLQVDADSPCIIMLKIKGTDLKEISVADPSRKLEKIHFRINRKIEKKGENFRAIWNKSHKLSEISIDLPQSGYAGESVTVAF
ncbi:MAG: polysaccharide lyase beta-sandwich domain-containing protein [Prevotellaceae bacterium]|jgi:chondroitin AC lyase|nr:polysaccharide lyase beta-sandwich domain-containing protein [Prevotellaceae bacterium]